MTPRERGGRSGWTSGYSAVWLGVASVRAVVTQAPHQPGQQALGRRAGGVVGGAVGVGHAVSTTQVAVSASCARARGTRKSQATRCSWSSRRRGQATRSQMTSDRDGRRLEQRPQRPEDVGEGAVPAAEEEHGEQQRHHHDAGVLGQQEEREAQPGVLRVGTEHDLGVGHRHVERRALQLGHGGDQEAHGAGQLPQQPERVPRGGDAGQGHRARGQRDRRRGQHDRQLVAQQLRRRAQPTEQRVLVGAGPPGHEGADDPDGGDGEDEQDAGVHVGGDHVRRQRDHRERDQVGHQRHGRRQLEDRPVGRGGGDVLLLDELHPVGDELGPPVEATGVHRPEPALHVRHHLVLGLPDHQRQDQERGQDRHRAQDDLEGGVHRGVARAVIAAPTTGRAPREGRPCAGSVARRPGRGARPAPFPPAPRRPRPAPWPPATPC